MYRKKTPDQLQPGDVILTDVLCRVTVTTITEQEGSIGRGNRAIGWTNPEPVARDGVDNVGSAISVKVVTS